MISFCPGFHIHIHTHMYTHRQPFYLAVDGVPGQRHDGALVRALHQLVLLPAAPLLLPLLLLPLLALAAAVTVGRCELGGEGEWMDGVSEPPATKHRAAATTIQPTQTPTSKSKPQPLTPPPPQPPPLLHRRHTTPPGAAPAPRPTPAQARAGPPRPDPKSRSPGGMSPLRRRSRGRPGGVGFWVFWGVWAVSGNGFKRGGEGGLYVCVCL